MTGFGHCQDIDFRKWLLESKGHRINQGKTLSPCSSHQNAVSWNSWTNTDGFLSSWFTHVYNMRSDPSPALNYLELMLQIGKVGNVLANAPPTFGQLLRTWPFKMREQFLSKNQGQRRAFPGPRSLQTSPRREPSIAFFRSVAPRWPPGSDRSDGACKLSSTWALWGSWCFRSFPALAQVEAELNANGIRKHLRIIQTWSFKEFLLVDFFPGIRQN